jgi:hypothetical protein
MYKPAYRDLKVEEQNERREVFCRARQWGGIAVARTTTNKRLLRSYLVG